jgi:hypothetical protein
MQHAFTKRCTGIAGYTRHRRSTAGYTRHRRSTTGYTRHRRSTTGCTRHRRSAAGCQFAAPPKIWMVKHLAHICDRLPRLPSINNWSALWHNKWYNAGLLHSQEGLMRSHPRENSWSKIAPGSTQTTMWILVGCKSYRAYLTGNRTSRTSKLIV